MTDLRDSEYRGRLKVTHLQRDALYDIPHRATWSGFSGARTYGALTKKQRRSLRRYFKEYGCTLTEIQITTQVRFERLWDWSNQRGYWRALWISKYRYRK